MSIQSTKLSPSPKNTNGKRVLIVVLDGIGYVKAEQSVTEALHHNRGFLPTTAFYTGNAVNAAYTPNLTHLVNSYPFCTLKAHGPAVGMPSWEDMGNSEVGHNAIGAGRVFDQGAKLVENAINEKTLFAGACWKKIVHKASLLDGTATLHFCGLLSDGNVHSHIHHLKQMVGEAKADGVKRVRIHALLDGRDVPPTSALQYVADIESFLTQQRSQDFDCAVASGGGRMHMTMDRYEADWEMVKRGYDAHVLGKARGFHSFQEAVETLYAETGATDQNLPAFVIHRNGAPVGTVQDGDSFIFFNFRGDRALEISQALTEKDFNAFTRERFPQIDFAGMMQYDGDTQTPENFLVNPPKITGTMTERLSRSNIKQFACSETQKYGHVTYFWNGNRSEKFSEELENDVEIPSDNVPFNQRPWMKAAEITDRAIAAMRQNEFHVGRINYANGDMVGHTGDFAATLTAVCCVDLCVGRLVEAARETDTVLLITADHGNADALFEIDKNTQQAVLDPQGLPKNKTSHTLAEVPFVVVKPDTLTCSLSDEVESPGLANIAATTLEIAGFEPPTEYEPSLLKWDTPPSPNTKQTPRQKRELSSQEELNIARASVDFAETIARLRAPDGCPWDREQTLPSLQKYLIEETYETVEALNEALQKEKEQGPQAGHYQDFADELGDVLLQVFLNAQIAKESNYFSVDEVINRINDKMIRRHPHVFYPDQNLNNSSDVIAQWEKIKANEKGDEKVNGRSLLDKALRKTSLPSLEFGTEVSYRSRKIGFAWPTLTETFKDIENEVDELKEVVALANLSDPQWLDRVWDETGDIFYAVCNLMSWFQVNLGKDSVPSIDVIARSGIRKFINRFFEMEKIYFEKTGKPLTDHSFNDLQDWDQLWTLAKRRRYK